MKKIILMTILLLSTIRCFAQEVPDPYAAYHNSKDEQSYQDSHKETKWSDIKFGQGL